MKFTEVFILIFFFSQFAFSQINPGATCDEAGCSTSGSCPSLTNVPDMGTFDCLNTTPNPNWIAIGVGSAGNIGLTISQNGDVDFAAYGPYSSVTEGCPIGPNTPTVDCSYSASATETVFIPNVLPGQVYIILITNFSNNPGTISVTPTGSNTAGINCNIDFSIDMSMTPSSCGQATGTATAIPNGGFSPYTYTWNAPGNPTTQTISGLLPGTYSVTVTSSPGPNGTSYNPITQSITVTNNNGSYAVTSTKVSCPGGSNGTATATMTPNIGNISYLWSDGQTTATATNLAAGTYTVNVSSDAGCNQTLTVNVTEIPGTIANVTSFTDVTCNSHNDGTASISVSQGTSPYTFAWDQSSSTTNIASDLGQGLHTVTISDINNCVIQMTQQINEPAPLNISFLTPDTQICPENSIELVVNGSGGSSPYLYTWESNGNVISADSNVVVDPDVTNTIYCVTLNEVCGSPETTQCLNITFPTPIIPSLIPDTTMHCSPGTFIFDNTSSNSGEIAYSHFAFDDQAVALKEGNDTISHTFRDPGFHTVILTTTSIYGCVYADTFTDIVNVIPIPVADFTFSTNPTTIFETVTLCQDRSTSDVIKWQWISDDSYPTSSALQSPKFEFPDGKTGQYPVTLIVSTENNCFDTITKVLHVIEDVLFFAPNSFTPDDDEFNQTWRFYASGIDIYQFEIKLFNRWGEVIWESRDPEAEWDGTFNGRPVPSGAYIWIATTKSVRNDEKRNFSGTINLLR